MKRFAVFLVALATCAAASFPAAAAQQAPQPGAVTVSLGTMETVLSDYSLDAKAALNTLDQARSGYRDKKEWGEITQADRDTLSAAELTYRDTFRHLVLSAKRQYLTYCADSSLLSADEAAAQNARAQLETDAAMLRQGYLSQNAYNESLENSQKLDAAARAQDTKVTQGRKTLRTLLNIPANVDMQILQPADSEMNFSGIPALKYGEDLIEMKRANDSIRIDSMNYATVRKEIASSDEQIENAQIKLTQTEQTQTTAFRSLYDTLQNSYRTYGQELEQVARREREAEAQERQLALGYISRRQYDDAVSALRNLRCQREADRNALYLSLLQYQDMKAGISAAGSQA
ncbi:MAG TPA: hypothetical protein DCL64_02955 [Ruminococcaceae bacterium]|nr:hypothetical protein [Oscillospiraceae bacterium]HBQ47241.1 hypothetical protein [Oscillospiraceae bacterium]